MIEVEVGAIMRLLLPSDRPCPLSLRFHIEDLEMAKQSFDGWQTAEVEFGDFPPPGAGDAGGEPDGTGNLGGEGESDRSDWDRFFAYCDGVIVAALARQPIQPADQEDCHQEIWVELLATRMSRFRGGSLAAWLGTLARNKAIDTIRRARRHAVGLAIEATERAVVDPAGLCPADEPGSVVWQALSELERQIEQRSYAVFFLRWFERMSFGQIAGALSLTPEQARARHHRTKAKFRQIVEKQVVRGQARG
jgi:RNA polymerase sigma factor (sigma-70 family)